MKPYVERPIVLDTEESQECHRILDWLASHSSPCVDCGATEHDPTHTPNCMVMRSYRLIERWSHA